MESTEQHAAFAWQPLTPRGVAAFAMASAKHLLLVQLMVAALVAALVVWFAASTWFSSIRLAIEHLPAQGEIRSGQLHWGAESPQVLADSRFLALSVDLAHTGQTRTPAHIQVEFAKTDFRIYSLFGCLPWSYPSDYAIAFNQQELKPWWGAWAPVLLALTAAAVVVGLMISWALLALLYSLPAWLLALYADRQLSLCGSWRLAGAALMPGALVMSAAIALYGLAALDVVRLLAAWALHLLIGWSYVVLGVLAAPKVASTYSGKINPFKSAPTEPAQAQPVGQNNPFGAGDQSDSERNHGIHGIRGTGENQPLITANQKTGTPRDCNGNETGKS